MHTYFVSRNKINVFYDGKKDYIECKGKITSDQTIELEYSNKTVKLITKLKYIFIKDKN